METISIGLVGLGGFLIWAAITGRNPVETARSVLSGGQAPERKRLDLGAAEPSGSVPTTGAPAGPAAVPAGAQSLTTTVPAGRDAGRSAGTGDQGDPLVYIGQGGHRLRPEAAAAFARAQQTLGRRILLTDSYRSYAQQVAAKKAKPNLAATPGKSLHERGLAIDVVGPHTDELAAALTAAGWVQFNRKKEPWHWSYGRKG